MYRITEHLDGRFEGRCTIQDGTEYFEEATLAGAVARMVEAAKIMNHADIDFGDIRFLRERVDDSPRTIVEVVERATAYAPPVIEDVGPTKYPPGLKGLLLRLADQL